jgi:hypothetical protein
MAAMTLRRDIDPVIPPPQDDYHVEGHGAILPPSVGIRIIYALQILMILALAALSFAIFWVVGVVLNIL